jgi:hypothetical protein
MRAEFGSGTQLTARTERASCEMPLLATYMRSGMRADVNENGISWELSGGREVGSSGSDGSVAWLHVSCSLASAGETIRTVRPVRRAIAWGRKLSIMARLFKGGREWVHVRFREPIHSSRAFSSLDGGRQRCAKWQ